ncbi:hypothetical protein GW17_00018473, partial [Ensete ventricosum]
LSLSFLLCRRRRRLRDPDSPPLPFRFPTTPTLPLRRRLPSSSVLLPPPPLLQSNHCWDSHALSLVLPSRDAEPPCSALAFDSASSPASDLTRLATWASKEARVAPLAAFLGERLASKAEASGIPLDPSTLLCERCETILQPGNSCTVRIEKVTNKRRRVNKSRFPRQNNVIYACHFCSHRNLKPGTAKGCVRALLDAHPGHTSSKSNSYGPKSEIKGDSGMAIEVLQHTAGSQIPQEPELNSGLNSSGPDTNAAAGSVALKSPVTPLMKMINKSNKKRKKANGSTTNNGLATADSGQAIGGSSKRRRKGWSSLKEIVESSESKNDRSINNLSIPFLLA